VGALERYKQKSSALARVAAGRAEVKMAVHSAEILGGAFVGGVLATNVPEIMGVPPDAGLGLLLVGVGIGMKQRDVASVGLGMLCGAANQYGRTLSIPMPGAP